MNKNKKFIVKKMVVKYIDTDNNIGILRYKLNAIFIDFETRNTRMMFDCPIYTVYFETSDEDGQERPNYVNNKDVDYVINKDISLALMDAEDAVQNYKYTLQRYRDKDSILYLPKVNILFTYPSSDEYKEELGINLWRNLNGYTQTPNMKFITIITNSFGEKIYIFDTSFVRVFINDSINNVPKGLKPVHNMVLQYKFSDIASKGSIMIEKQNKIKDIEYYEDMEEFTSIRKYLYKEMSRINNEKQEDNIDFDYIVSIAFSASNSSESKAKCDNIMNEINLLMKESGFQYAIYNGIQTKFPEE